MKIHENGGGKVAFTATVDATAFVGIDCEVLDNAIVGAGCVVESGSTIYGDAVLTNNSSVSNNAKVGGTAFLSDTKIHGSVVLERTPITLNGFPVQVVIAHSFVIIGCQTISVEEWETKSIAFLRVNGYPKKSAERIRDSINVILYCYKSIYHEDDLKEAFKFS
jgi:carbonic anhydrase/acetyltransferase-like protein (isoleucine patch superfamily)